MIPPTQMLIEVVVKIMIEFLSVLALVSKQIKQGRLSKCAVTYDCSLLDVPQRSSQRSYWGRAR